VQLILDYDELIEGNRRRTNQHKNPCSVHYTIYMSFVYIKKGMRFGGRFDFRVWVWFGFGIGNKLNLVKEKILMKMEN